MRYELPVVYDDYTSAERRQIREQYVEDQKGFCMYCSAPLSFGPPDYVTEKDIDWILFPPNFLRHPVHLQHDHVTGLTEGAVHAYCNAVMWHYEGR